MLNLDKYQTKAVMATEQNQLIVAGAGAGKTRTIVAKINYLLQLGIMAVRILAITFTNKAADEMKKKVAYEVGNETARLLKIGTFHSIMLMIIRKYAKELYDADDISVYDEHETTTIIKNIITKLGYDGKVYKPSAVAGRISWAKNNCISPSIYRDSANIIEEDAENNLGNIYKIYEEYEKSLLSCHATDFDGILFYTYKLLSQNEDIAEEVSSSLDYILIDEYQDTNKIQNEIIKILSRKAYIIAVGDDAQNIYSFRGADIGNMLNFQNIFLGAEVYTLNQNYRSTDKIVAAANSLIAKNKNQIKKDVFSTLKSQSKVDIVRYLTDRDEAREICNQIKEWKRGNYVNYKDIAILYRTNALSRAMEEELNRQDIPYTVNQGISYYDRKEIKNVTCYLRLIVNAWDDEAFKRIINYPKRGLGSKAVEELERAAVNFNVPLLYAADSARKFHIDLPEKKLETLESFAAAIEELSWKVRTDSPSELINETLEKFNIYKAILEEEDGDKRLNNVNELFSSSESYAEENQGNLSDYIQTLSLKCKKDENQEDRVNLMTIHASKGLEFKGVFVIGMEEGVFPSDKSSHSPKELEEERRLAYVAMTRAIYYLNMSGVNSRYIYGEQKISKESRFLREIDGNFCNHVDYTKTDTIEDEYVFK